jgi:hypothetical protein
MDQFIFIQRFGQLDSGLKAVPSHFIQVHPGDLYPGMTETDSGSYHAVIRHVDIMYLA